MFYAWANFDDQVFENPTTFDITRNPNPHLGFGGSGPAVAADIHTNFGPELA